MKISIENFEHDFKKLDTKIRKIARSEEPEFARYNPDIPFFKKTLKPFRKYKNIILIGHGGSITTTQGFYGALKAKKKLFVVDTPEPDYIFSIKKQCKKRDSLVVVVSKSGTNVDILEIVMDFLEYKILVITNPESGALLQISKKLNLKMVEHPNIGGRFSGFTSSTLVPAYLLGFNIEKLFEGAKDMYKKCSYSTSLHENPALKIATGYYLEELSGKDEIFSPIYSKKLFDFSNLLIQLLHESSCKNGKGQTIYTASAPESQHHTNQRFFGGKKNTCALFITTTPQMQSEDKKIKVPKKLKEIILKDGTLGDLDGNRYSQILHFEYLGVLEHARKEKIPHAEIMIENGDEYELGQFVALWHYIAVFASLLRDVNPFDQPEVEYSKNISFEMRRKARRKKNNSY